MAKKIVIRSANSSVPMPKTAAKKMAYGNRASTASLALGRLGHFLSKIPKIAWGVLIAMLLLVVIFMLINNLTKAPVNEPIENEKAKQLEPSAPQSLEDLLGFDPEKYQSKDYTQSSYNRSLKNWLDSLNIEAGFRKLVVGKAKQLGIDTIYKSRTFKVYQDTFHSDVYAVYQKSALEYAVFQFSPFPVVKLVQLPIKYRLTPASGVLRDSQMLFWLLVQEIGFDIAQQAEEALKHSVDFYHLENGDEFKLFFEEKVVFNKIIGRGALKAISLKTHGKTHYAIRCNIQSGPVYLDEDAKSVEKTFLLAPLKNVRISSRYNPSRLHPVLQEIKPHLGTDYAAPEGTEIFSVADGIVIETGYKTYNGNYLKIRHDATYTTQYLHMKEYALGIKQGVKVRMGQVIGLVGQTGEKITGPHVCFRFWKGEKQVDHLKESFKSISKLTMQEEDESRVLCNQFKHRLDQLSIKVVSNPLGI